MEQFNRPLGAFMRCWELNPDAGVRHLMPSLTNGTAGSVCNQRCKAEFSSCVNTRASYILQSLGVPEVS